MALESLKDALAEIELMTQVAPSLPTIWGLEENLVDIMIELLKNSIKAVDGRPTPLIQIRMHSPDSGVVQIEVEDNGVGIPAKNMDKMFRHGFTTKEDGHGFGLHSSALAAQETGGSLTVHSNGPGQGATFTLELPLKLEAVTNG